MALTNEAQHVYQRDIQANVRTSLSVLCSYIPPGARVLDLGCGTGAIGRFLAARDDGNVFADGLTISAQEAVAAEPFYQKIVVADLDKCGLEDHFPSASYDVIVCADVLEHIRDSARVLRQCRNLLANNGKLLISIPNVAYAGLLAELLEGEFRYRDEGLLDTTHVRFFTRRTLEGFLSAEAWRVESLDTIERELPDSEFRASFDALPPAVARYLLSLPDAKTYQFLIIASPSDTRVADPDPQTLPAVSGPPMKALFTSQLFLARSGKYHETDKLTAAGVIGEDLQTIRFELPAGAPPERLRFDPADRPGFLHLYAMRLLGTGGELWRWDADDSRQLSDARHDNMVIRRQWALSHSALLLLTNEDPWIELPIPSASLAQSGGAVLEIDVGWPMSADYLALSDAVHTVRNQGALIQDRLHARVGELEALLTTTTDALSETRRDLEQSLNRHALDTERLATQFRLINDLTARSHTLSAQRDSLSAQRDEAFQLVRSIENSTIFRTTRPLVRAKMWLDRRLGRESTTPEVHQTEPPVPRPDTPVDIIVPVYRGLDDTRRCLTSVLNSECRTAWRLLVINDASPEPEVTQFLRELAAQDQRVELLENDSNLGFVGTVNRGMALAPDRDVLLLNSDAEVANDWLDRILSAAYSGGRIASVTPFSNNATICSYPRFCENNTLPAGHTLADMDALCAKVLAGRTVAVPTGVGFCMFIRRAALELVGLFDEENFGKGYGEENDFCQRAIDAGWRNLHLLDTYVFHAGGVSFGASKSPRERAAMETMRRLHPRYEADVIRFVQKDPAAPARALLDYARVTLAGAPTILAVLHNREGGTVRHVRDLVDLLANKARLLVLQCAPGGDVLLRPGDGAAGQSELRFSLPDQFDDLLDVLRGLGVRHIHFHHTLGHGTLITETLPRRLGVSHDFTVHDFYAACPQISMIASDGRYCGEEGLGQCRECLRKQPAPEGVDIQTWRETHAELLMAARYVMAPSRDALRRMAHYFPNANYRLVPHPEQKATSEVDARLTENPAPVTAVNPGSPLRIAVIGALSAIKGADVLEDVARETTKTGAPLEFHLIGYAYRSLVTQPKAALTVHGRYEESDLANLLAWLKPDLIWFPAQVPETYSYTLSAALAARLPVVATNLGAFAERLRARHWSWIRPWNDSASDWILFFLRIKKDHFEQLKAPPVVIPLDTLNPGSEQIMEAIDPEVWYRDEYLQDIPSSEPNVPPEELITRHLVPVGSGATSNPARRGALSALVRLRSLPALAPVARMIPPRLQARVKNWLMH